MSLSRLIARPLLAAGIVYGAQNALRNTGTVASKAAPVTDKIVPLVRKAGVPLPDDPATLVRINAGVQIAGALALATGKAPRLGAAAIAVTLVPTTVAGHAFWAETDPAQEERPAPAVLQEPLPARRHPDRRRRHRRQAGRGLAHASRRQGRPPRGQAPRGLGSS